MCNRVLNMHTSLQPQCGFHAERDHRRAHNVNCDTTQRRDGRTQMSQCPNQVDAQGMWCDDHGSTGQSSQSRGAQSHERLGCGSGHVTSVRCGRVSHSKQQAASRERCLRMRGRDDGSTDNSSATTSSPSAVGLSQGTTVGTQGDGRHEHHGSQKRVGCAHGSAHALRTTTAKHHCTTTHGDTWWHACTRT